MGVWGSTQNISTSESFGCVVHRKSQVATPGSWQTESKSGYPKMDWFNIWERDKHANSSCGPVSSYWAIPVFPSNPHVFCFEKTWKNTWSLEASGPRKRVSLQWSCWHLDSLDRDFWWDQGIQADAANPTDWSLMTWQAALNDIRWMADVPQFSPFNGRFSWFLFPLNDRCPIHFPYDKMVDVPIHFSHSMFLIFSPSIWWIFPSIFPIFPSFQQAHLW